MIAPRLVLYGHFGSGNLGNDSTLEAVLSYIEMNMPTASVICICAQPQIITEKYGIQTLPIDASGYARGHLSNRKGLRIFQKFINRIADEIDFWFRWTGVLRRADMFIVVGTGAADDMGVRPWKAPIGSLYVLVQTSDTRGGGRRFRPGRVCGISHPASRPASPCA